MANGFILKHSTNVSSFLQGLTCKLLICVLDMNIGELASDQIFARQTSHSSSACSYMKIMIKPRSQASEEIVYYSMNPIIKKRSINCGSRLLQPEVEKVFM